MPGNASRLALVVALVIAVGWSDRGAGAESVTTPAEPVGIACEFAPVDTTPAMSAPASTAAPGETEPLREGSNPAGVVSRADAEQAALAAVGSGRVTWSAPEDDRGAAWEVEITRPDGSEVDVYVAADGTVIKQVCKLGEGPALEGGGEPPTDGPVSQEQAAQAALDALGEGMVTWIEREDERGAMWEIEVTLSDGREIDVLVAADGSVIG